MVGTDSERLSFAIDVSRSVGALIREFRANSRFTVKLKGPQDYVTDLDQEAERIIRQRISTEYPDDTVFGEEMSGVLSSSTWFVDPIDGTSNYVRGIPHYAISIGYVRGGEPCVGVIYDPELDLLYSTQRGCGAFCNGQRISVASTPDLKFAMIEIGCWRRKPPPSNYSNSIQQVLSAGLDFRWRGSAALALADVARGHSDAFCGLHLNSWDAAAGILLVVEAGGRTTDFFANNGLRKGNFLLACVPDLFGELQSLMDPSRCGSAMPSDT